MDQIEMIPLAQEPWHASSHLRSILMEEWVEAGIVFPWHGEWYFWASMAGFHFSGEEESLCYRACLLLRLLPLGMQTDTCFTERARHHQGREYKPPSMRDLSFDFYWHDKAVQCLFQMRGKHSGISLVVESNSDPPVGHTTGKVPLPSYWTMP